jgi:hypothetical protein
VIPHSIENRIEIQVCFQFEIEIKARDVFGIDFGGVGMPKHGDSLRQPVVTTNVTARVPTSKLVCN